MTFIDDLEQICYLTESIADDSNLPRATVQLPDMTGLLANLAGAGLTSVAHEFGDAQNLEVIAATIGTQVGLAKAGVLYPIADFDLFPKRLATGTECESALHKRTLLVPWSAIDAGQPVSWATHPDALLSYRTSETGAELALIEDFQLSETFAGIDGAPVAIVKPNIAPTWVAASILDHDWIVSVRQITSLAVTAALLSRVVDIVTRYAAERTQFGRPVGRFQAVQQLISECATQSEMVASAAASALQHLSSPNGLTRVSKLEIASGCIVSYDAIEIVVRNSHQVTGAIGTTLEHSLQRFTRSLLQVRRQLDTYDELLAALSDLVDSNDEQVWDVITA